MLRANDRTRNGPTKRLLDKESAVLVNGAPGAPGIPPTWTSSAWMGASALCPVSNRGFSRSSARYVGTSDGWPDFSRNGRMTWQHREAIDGNVALTQLRRST